MRRKSQLQLKGTFQQKAVLKMNQQRASLQETGDQVQILQDNINKDVPFAKIANRSKPEMARNDYTEVQQINEKPAN